MSKILKQSGNWKLVEFEVTQEDEDRQKSSTSYFRSGRYVPKGTYKRLMRDATVVMSNTPDELSDIRPFMFEVKGKIFEYDHVNVLVAGLGMGCVIDELLKLDDIENITIIEKSVDVINITAEKYLNDKRVMILNGDIFDINLKQLPCKHYHIGWFDIWDYICEDNLEEFSRLKRKYAKKVGLKKFWAERECRRGF